MSLIRNVARAGQLAVRNYSNKPATKGEVHPGYLKLKEIQKLYQKDDGLPVHLKRGARDRALYYFTVALIAYGLYDGFKMIYDLAQK